MNLRSLLARRRPFVVGVLVAFAVALSCAAGIVFLERQRIDANRAAVAAQVADKAQDLRSVIEHALASTYAVAALLRQGKGSVADFPAAAEQMLPFYPGAASLGLAPKGVMREVVPQQENVAVIGHDLLADPERNREAVVARDTGKLTLAGPFTLRQDGVGAVGRLPVFLPGDDGREAFWGFVSVVLRFPQVLEAAGLPGLRERGFDYELSRMRPETGERQIIAASSALPLADPVRYPVEVPNAIWTLSVTPVGGWHDRMVLSLEAAGALVLSLALGWLAKSLVELRGSRIALEGVVEERTAALAARERDLQLAQNVAHVGSWRQDLEDGSVKWSAEAYRVFGLEPDSAPDAASFLACVHADERERVAKAWRDALGGVPFEIEHRVIAGVGVRWVRQRAELELDEHGAPLCVLGTVQDITRQKIAERELREREARLASLVASLPDKLIVIDRARRIVECHSPDPRLLVAPPECLIDRPYAETIPPEVARRYDEAIAGIDADGLSRQIEYTLPLEEGERHFSASVSRLACADGEGGYIALVRDISERVRMEAELHESEARYRVLFTDSRVVMLVIDPLDGRIVDANAKACAYYGYDHATLTGMRIWDLNVMPREWVLAEMERARVRRQDSFQFRHRLASGEVRDVEVASGPIEIAGRPLLYSIVQDVTERRRYEKHMREAMVVFNASSQAIMTTDAQGIITSVNPAFCAITGYAPDEVIGHRSSMFKSGRHDKAFFDEMWARLTEAGAWEGEIWNRRKSGENYPQWLTITAVRDAEGMVSEYVSLFSDITERKQQEEAMWRQANYDALTGLANRSLLQDRLERALAQARRHGGKVGLIFLDLDGFKWINDSLGHDVGDQLLVDVARRLQGCVRSEDTVARLGGDEFTVVVSDLHDQRDFEDLRTISEKLVAVLRSPFLLRNAPHYVSGSVGITVFPDDGEDVQSLLRNADIAMYKAKQAGKNRAQFYAPQMQADAIARLRVEADLRVALDEGQFVLHYQPIVDAREGTVVGAEALIRWSHPRRGMVSPGEFIQVAEDCGLIVPIGEWALREAVRQAQAWREDGHAPLRIAVNVSGVQFREPGLPELVRALLPDGEARAHLMLEITESVLMDGSEEAESRMREISEHGIGYSLDDFGTGFSSLSYLKRFPVDIVKIDRSFVRDCPDDRSDASLVEAIINMAHSLDLRVTAEGVETAAQREFLRGLRCDFLQGYLIGRPVPAAEFAAFARTHTPVQEESAERG